MVADRKLHRALNHVCPIKWGKRSAVETLTKRKKNMASYPTANVHRRSRRKLGRAQHQQSASVTTTAATTTPNVTLTFSDRVIVSGPLAITVGSLTILSQQQLSPTTYEFVMSGTTTTATYNFPGFQQNIATFQGGGVAGVSGTF
jgi:hypothetical protein